MITADQKKDLRVLKPEETFEVGGNYYLKNEDGSFSRCCIHQDDLKNEEHAHLLRLYTEKYLREGRLFVRRNAPWKSFEQ